MRSVCHQGGSIYGDQHLLCSRLMERSPLYRVPACFARNKLWRTASARVWNEKEKKMKRSTSGVPFQKLRCGARSLEPAGRSEAWNAVCVLEVCANLKYNSQFRISGTQYMHMRGLSGCGRQLSMLGQAARCRQRCDHRQELLRTHQPIGGRSSRPFSFSLSSKPSSFRRSLSNVRSRASSAALK